MATFKTRARTLDMLGRQQIAGIPTAINELFKNAHDAYADRVEVDFFLYSGLFVLRDDGLGMTEEDFRERWLTIGTESKLGTKSLELPPKDPEKKERPILGEKGIGRLAIAAIGPQVLVLSRAKRKDGLKDLVAAFIHWGLFECAGIDLDEIEIPLRTYQGGTLPDSNEIEAMVRDVCANTEKLRTRIGDEKADEIKSDLELFKIASLSIDKNLHPLSLLKDGCGTHFFIMPASEYLEMDIEGETDQESASPLCKFLLGFTNTMVPEIEEPVINAAFRYHKTKDGTQDLISREAFFTPDEFKNADHYFRGDFDEYGQFQGDISIFGEVNNSHTIPWKECRGIPTKCGPFSLDLAVIMGNNRESTLPFEDHAMIIEKTNRIGGLYIYKDGIRILPYGNTEFDWLDVEMRRSKQAAYYFFSHRRMFGAITINSEKNRELIEKAGREGFRENKAYRQFKAILRNFLVQLAADFFRQEGVYAEPYWEKKAELDHIERARSKREKTITAKRNKLKEQLNIFFDRCEVGKPSQEAIQLSEQIEERLSLAGKIDDPKAAAAAYMSIESMARQELNNLMETYRVVKPRGVGLGKKLTKDYNIYLNSYSNLEESVFSPARLLIEQEVTEKAKAARVELDRRIRVENALKELAEETKKSTKLETTQTRKALEKVSIEVKRSTTESLIKIENTLSKVFSMFSRKDVSNMRDEDLVNFRTSLENAIIDVKTSESCFLEHIRGQLESIDFGNGITNSDMMEALEDRVINLEEQSEVDLQLAQLGMAIGIINHEFNENVLSIRNNLQRLKAWADVNKNLQDVYLNIRVSFDHLDGYLTLFTPLQRRIHRQAIAIRGLDIEKFLKDLFARKFERHLIALKTTDPFKNKTIIEYPSSIYPVFVNLVDNAVFWLKDRPEPRIVTLDANNKAFIVADNGPGIQSRDKEDIFEMGFTRKPGGRGMGLFISREALRKTGYDLILEDNPSHHGARFMIQTRNDSGGQEED